MAGSVLTGNGRPGQTSDGAIDNYPGLRDSDYQLLTNKSLFVPRNATYRGYLRSAVGDNTDRTPTFHFHYNPSEISFSYDINEETLPMDSQGSEPVPNMVTGASIGFTLFLDRTEDMARGGAPNTDSPGNLGVLYDIDVLERVLGSSVTPEQAGGSAKGVITTTPIYAAFSNNGQALGTSIDATGIFSEPSVVTSTGMNFKGYPTSVLVNFTMFNWLMIPVRAELQITLRRIFNQPVADLGIQQGLIATPNAEGGRSYAP